MARMVTRDDRRLTHEEFDAYLEICERRGVKRVTLDTSGSIQVEFHDKTPMGQLAHILDNSDAPSGNAGTDDFDPDDFPDGFDPAANI